MQLSLIKHFDKPKPPTALHTVRKLGLARGPGDKNWDITQSQHKEVFLPALQLWKMAAIWSFPKQVLLQQTLYNILLQSFLKLSESINNK